MGNSVGSADGNCDRCELGGTFKTGRFRDKNNFVYHARIEIFAEREKKFQARPTLSEMLFLTWFDARKGVVYILAIGKAP